MVCQPEESHNKDVEEFHHSEDGIGEVHHLQDGRGHIPVAPQLAEGKVGIEGHHEEAHEQRSGKEGTQEHLDGAVRAGAAHHTEECSQITCAGGDNGFTL